MKYFLLTILGLSMSGVWSANAATNDFFLRGMAAERAGDFTEAATAFRQAVRQQPAAGTLVNLGIIEWQRGHAGAAILAWEQAQWIDPFDGHASHNLEFARMVAQVDDPQLKWYEAASTWLPPNSWVWLAGASLWLAVGALMLPGVFRWKKSGWLSTLAALGFGIFLFSLTANVGVVSRTEIGIVLKRNAPLLLTPTRESEIISTLNSGEPARRLRTHGDYYFINTPNGAGWIEADEFGLINPK
jgi:hypothetical protein